MKSNGFTVVELMIVIAVIGILAACIFGGVEPDKPSDTEQQARDRRTCVLNNMNFEVKDGNISCIPKSEETKEPEKECRVYLKSELQEICIN